MWWLWTNAGDFQVTKAKYYLNKNLPFCLDLRNRETVPFDTISRDKAVCKVSQGVLPAGSHSFRSITASIICLVVIGFLLFSLKTITAASNNLCRPCGSIGMGWKIGKSGSSKGSGRISAGSGLMGAGAAERDVALCGGAVLCDRLFGTVSSATISMPFSSHLCMICETSFIITLRP
jgi:hypothetical protein